MKTPAPVPCVAVSYCRAGTLAAVTGQNILFTGYYLLPISHIQLSMSVREELIVARTVQVLMLLSTEEQLEGEGETPRRPGRSGREGRGRVGLEGEEHGTG